MIPILNRRKFIEIIGCSCCSLILPSCTKVPITKRRQLSIYPEATINNQASKAYEKFRTKTKLINKGKQIRTIKEIGRKIENLTNCFLAQGSNEPLAAENKLTSPIQKIVIIKRM